MSSLSIEPCTYLNQFYINFQNGRASICVHQLLTMLIEIHTETPRLVELGLLWPMHNRSEFSDEPRFNLCFGRVVFVFSQEDMVEFMSEMWKTSPSLMSYVLDSTGDSAQVVYS